MVVFGGVGCTGGGKCSVDFATTAASGRANYHHQATRPVAKGEGRWGTPPPRQIRVLSPTFSILNYFSVQILFFYLSNTVDTVMVVA